jgi:hypothetical protein
MYKTSSHQSYTSNLAARHCLERQNTVLQRLQLRPAMRAFFCDQALLAGLAWPAVPVWIGSLWLLWSGVVGGGGSMCVLSMNRGRNVVT